MRNSLLFLLILSALLSTSCKKEEIIVNDSKAFVMNESKQAGQLEVNLSWSINGVPDDGTSSELILYISPSEFDYYAKMKDNFSSAYKSAFNYYGKEYLYPSGWDLEKLYHRYYIGVAYNGVYASTTGPLEIKYTLEFNLSGSPQDVKKISGEMTISPSEMQGTKVNYPCSFDINKINDDGDKSYAIRKLETPITIVRTDRDVEYTNTFSADSKLYMELYWKVNGKLQGFNDADLDLYVHNPSNNNIGSFEDLDYGSSNGGAYESLTIPANDPNFLDGEIKGIGFYPFALPQVKTGDVVTCYYKVFTYGSKMKTYYDSTTFTVPPIEVDNGKFYFDLSIEKSGGNYIVQKLAQREVW